MILEPDFDLSRGQIDEIGQLLSLRRGEIFLLLESPFQLVDLRLRKEDPPLASRSARRHAAHAAQGVMVVGEGMVMTATPRERVVMRVVMGAQVGGGGGGGGEGRGSRNAGSGGTQGRILLGGIAKDI